MERRERIIESVRWNIYRFVAALVLSLPVRTGTSREEGREGGRNRKKKKKKIKINRYRNPIFGLLVSFRWPYKMINHRPFDGLIN